MGSMKHAPVDRGSGGPDTPDIAAELRKLQDELALLRRSYQRVTGALRCVHDGVVVCDETGQVIFRNGTASASVSSSPSEILAEQAVREALAEALTGMSPVRDVELYGPPRKVLEVSAEPIAPGGDRMGAVALVEDISERKRIEAVRRDFVSNISHELRTPVGALLVLAETMVDEPSEEVLRRLAERMELEASRLARMVDDLLSLARIEAEDLPVRELVRVADIVDDAVERATPASRRCGVAVEIGDQSPETFVVGDRRQLVSALLNLIDNALKYSDEGRRVRVSVIAAPAGTEDVTDTGAMAEIHVRDEGIGIPPRDRERIFERFYRVDKARARDTGGTGLGLAIVRHVVGNHAGDVTVRSLEGEGSTFVIRLPLQNPPVDVPAPIDPASAPLIDA